MIELLKLAIKPTVIKRAMKYAAIVGAILITINHGDAILRREVDSTRILKMLLTITVPYVVSTSSSVGAIREMQKERDVKKTEASA